MYSRSYGRGDASAKITPPPAYSGSAIQGGEKAGAEKEEAHTGGKEKGLLSSLLPDLSKEDLILIGIVVALAFDLADRDILLVALVAAAVIM